MEYQDFTIKIEPGGSGEYSVLVLQSPAGEGRGRFRTPFEEQDIPALLSNLGRSRTHRDQPEKTPALDPATVGDTLYRALFSDQVLALYNQSLGSLLGRADCGLRIRLHLDPSNSDLAPVCKLPWELLRRDGRDYLSLDLLSPVVRYLEVDRPSEPVPLKPPLRVLLVASSPLGVEPLDLSEEESLIGSAWAGQKDVEVELLEKPTRESLRQARRPIHVLHFMGHGAFKDDVGALVFETPEKRTDLVTGQELMRLLQPGIPPAVVILNACNTGTAEGGPFSGVAASLVKSGLLAVVAMQFPITDWAALVFSSTLYRHLAQGDPVDTAVSEGRHAILLDDPNSTEWSTPVLFLRTPNGHVLEPSRVSVQEKEEAVWLLEDLTEIDLDQLLAALEPGVTSPDRTTRVRQRLTVAARRGGEDWLKFLESLLAVRSPVSIFDGSLRHWRASTEGLWRPEGEELLGEGEDFPIFSEPPGLEEASLLTWEGLPFRDGTLASRVSMPFPGWGGACGLGMRCTPQVAVFGLLRDLPSAPSLELWQKQGDRLVPVGDSVPLPKKPGGLFDLSLRLEGRDVTLYCGSIELKAQLAVDLHAGFAGVIKFAGTSVYLSSLILEVPLCATPIGGNP